MIARAQLSTPGPKFCSPAGIISVRRLRYNNRVIGGGSTMTGIATQIVPFIAPAGVYHYIGRVGIYPDSVLAQSWFPFEVSAAGDNKVNGEGEGWNLSGWFSDESSSSIQHSSFSIQYSYPNPFNAKTVVSFEMRDASNVKLSVYDINGRRAASLVDGHLSAGPHEIAFDGKELPSGVYFVMLEAGGETQVRKLLLVK